MWIKPHSLCIISKKKKSSKKIHIKSSDKYSRKISTGKSNRNTSVSSAEWSNFRLSQQTETSELSLTSVFFFSGIGYFVVVVDWKLFFFLSSKRNCRSTLCVLWLDQDKTENSKYTRQPHKFQVNLVRVFVIALDVSHCVLASHIKIEWTKVYAA